MPAPEDDRPHWTRRHAAALRVALAAYSVVVALVLGWPTPTVPVVGTLELVSRWLREAGAPDWVGGSLLEFVCNIALFVPFGALVALAVPRRPWWWAALTGFAFSLVAELTQEFFLPHRSGTVSDVVANTAGTAIGAGAAWALLRWRSRSDRAAGGAGRAGGAGGAGDAAAQRRPSAR